MCVTRVSSSLPVGTLCGRCINGTGVGVLRTNCRECQGDNYYAIALLGQLVCVRARMCACVCAPACVYISHIYCVNLALCLYTVYVCVCFYTGLVSVFDVCIYSVCVSLQLLVISY